MGWDPTLDFSFLQIILSEETDSDPFFGEALPSYFFHTSKIFAKNVNRRERRLKEFYLPLK